MLSTHSVMSALCSLRAKRPMAMAEIVHPWRSPLAKTARLEPTRSTIPAPWRRPVNPRPATCSPCWAMTPRNTTTTLKPRASTTAPHCATPR
jgi:hypothetical protein